MGGKGLVGSLRRQAEFEVRLHRKTNAALIKARRDLGVRFLQGLLGNRGFVSILGLYAALIVLLLVWSSIDGSLPLWRLAWVQDIPKSITGYFLTAQVTAIGLLFPIAVSLVTLIVQREVASSTSSDVQIYYSESLAYRIGASGMALSIVLAGHLLWPKSAVASTGDAEAYLFLSPIEPSLVVLHLLWLATNLAALWHFFVTSLSFIRPAERATMRRRYAANVAIPRELSDKIIRVLYLSLNSTDRVLVKNATEGRINLRFGAVFDLDGRGESEVFAPGAVNKELHDVWLRPLSMAVNRWWKRSLRYARRQQGEEAAANLVFLADFGMPFRPSGLICRRQGGVPMTLLERALIKVSFRFRRR